MLIDTHCHLTDERLSDIKAIMARAVDCGVEKMIVATTNVDDLKKALDATQGYENIYVIAGIHPEHIEEITNIKHQISNVREVIKNNRDKIVGIGEIGLDFYWDKEKKTKEAQIELFKGMLELALDLDLPVEIHSRDAQEETVEVLTNLPMMPKGQFHCFGGGEDFLEWVLEKGFFVSFAGNVTFKKADLLRQLVEKTPIDRLILETDSPYLAPDPLRGTVNEPKNVKIIAECIAQIKGLTSGEIADTTTKNAICLYSLENC